jgi:hypothetical protein
VEGRLDVDVIEPSGVATRALARRRRPRGAIGTATRRLGTPGGEEE